jgi:hypothetical protein
MSQMTITQGLSLPDSQADLLIEVAVQACKDCDTKSDALLQAGTHVKDELLGEDVALGEYERKLLFVGLVIGEAVAKASQRAEMVERKMRELFGGMSRPTDD